MILKNIKKYSSAQAGSDIKDAVLTVPAHLGFRSRMSLVNAAAIADLNVLGLINENSAAAIHLPSPEMILNLSMLVSST